MIQLDEQTMRLLHAEARENAQSIDEFVQAAIVAYIRDLSTLPQAASPSEERRLRIRQEADAWRSLPQEERRRYGDVYVAVYNGEVVDSDSDRIALFRRIREQYIDETVLITPAAEPLRQFSRIGLRRS